jgi:putative ABC transport system permease protein
VAFGLMAPVHLSRQDLHESLKEGGRQQGPAIARGARELLIVAEVALSIVLLVGAGLLVRSLWQLQQVNPGFTAENVLAMEVSLPTARYEEGEQMPFYQRLEERIRSIAGVAEVGAINILPLSNNYDSRGIQVEDRPMPEGQGFGPQARSITPGYFRAMRIPLIRGREFDAHDIEDAQRVVIISRTMADKYWPGEDALGKRITFNSGIPREQQQTVGGPGSRIVIGIVGDVKHLGLDEGEVPMFYTPHTQQPSYHTMRVVVRANADAASLTRQVREGLSEMDRDVPLSQVATLTRALDATVAAPRMRATLMAIFAGLAMILAAVGVYGVVAYTVGQRTREIGIRRALGARAPDVLRMLLREGLRPVALGILLGAAGALAVTRALSAMLFGVSAADAPTYVIACGTLALAAVAATIIPARRALGVDPISAVRGD